MPCDEVGCTSVQRLAIRRAEVGVDSGPIERMSEGQLRCEDPLAHQPGRDGFIDGMGCVRRPGDRRDHRCRRVMPQHRSGRQKRLGCGRERCHPGEDHRGQLPRRRQSPILLVQCDDADLVEQCPAVEGVPFRVSRQSRGASGCERSETQRARELRQLARIEAPETDLSDPRIATEEPSPARVGQPARSSRDNREHLVGPKSPEREEHCARTRVGRPSADRRLSAPRPDHRTVVDRPVPAAVPRQPSGLSRAPSVTHAPAGRRAHKKGASRPHPRPPGQ